MAVNGKPRGSVVRTPPDWFDQALVGAGSDNGPCVGNLVGVGLYNNASDGSVIRVYGLNLYTMTTQGLFAKSFYGTNGALVGAGKVPAKAIDPRAPAQWGVLYTQATAAGVGTPNQWFLAQANTVYDLSPGYPLMIIPPGWTGSVECTSSNTYIAVGFRFLSVYV